MRTWGQLRFELSKFQPGVDLDLITQWLNAAYEDVLDYFPWKGLERDAVLQTIAPYTAGTVALTAASTAVTGTGTTWTTAMTGLAFQPDSQGESYTFTYVSATTGTLDRPYEGTTAAAATYRIYTLAYALPSDVKYIQRFGNARLVGGGLNGWTEEDLVGVGGARYVFGEPRYFIPFSDTPESSPPVLHRVQFYPIPSAAAGYPYTYQKNPVMFAVDGSNTTASPLPWVRDAAVIAGAKARILAHAKDYAGSDREQARAIASRTQMLSVETMRVGPVTMKLDERFTRHRQRRWAR